MTRTIQSLQDKIKQLQAENERLKKTIKNMNYDYKHRMSHEHIHPLDLG